MNRHRLDPVSLALGLVTVALSLVGLVGGVSFSALRWVWPGLLVVVGGALLAVALAPGRREGGSDDATPTDEDVAPHHRDELLDEARAEVEASDVTTD